MRPDPIIEEIRMFREAKAAEYGYNAATAFKDFERLHKELMQVRSSEPVSRLRAAKKPAMPHRTR